MKSALRESVRPFTLTALTVAIFWVMMGTARIYADQREYPRFAAAESSRMITPPAQGETIEGVCDFIKRKIDQVQTMKCEVELSKWRERKPRRVSTGPLELEREKGAYVRLTRKDETSEYIVNAVMIWDYDLKDKKAQYIPTIMPIIGFFVKEAMALNILLSLDKDTLKLRGSVEVEGEPCWMVEGKTPRRLEVVGLFPAPVKVFVSKRDGIIRRVLIPDKSKTIILLRKISINQPVDASRFQFKPPPDVKTVNILGF